MFATHARLAGVLWCKARSSHTTGWCKTGFLEVFRPYLDLKSEIKNSVTTYIALEYVKAMYQVSALSTKL